MSTLLPNADIDGAALAGPLRATKRTSVGVLAFCKVRHRPPTRGVLSCVILQCARPPVAINTGSWRRKFIAALGRMAVWPLAAHTQQAAVKPG